MTAALPDTEGAGQFRSFAAGSDLLSPRHGPLPAPMTSNSGISVINERVSTGGGSSWTLILAAGPQCHGVEGVGGVRDLARTVKELALSPGHDGLPGLIRVYSACL